MGRPAAPGVREVIRRTASSVVALLAAVLVLVGGPGLLGVPLPGAAAEPDPASDTSPIPDPDPRFVRISLLSVSPDAVGPHDGEVVVTGRVENIGSAPVSAVDVRLQRAPALTDPLQARTTLTWDESTYAHSSRFRRVAEDLEPGASVVFEISMPLRARAGVEGLDIRAPGVYPLLLNVNGDVNRGPTARLHDARFLLPVLAEPVPGTTAGEAGAEPPTPLRTSILWPLAGSTDQLPATDDSGRPRLAGGSLPRALEPGGRLDGMLTALGPESPDARTPLRDATCIAIDPALLDVVDRMTRGYDVETGASKAEGFDSSPTATAWLERLRALAKGSCVVALPWGSPDLDAVARLRPPVRRLALTDGPGTIERILGVRPLEDLLPSPTGTLDPASREAVTRGNPLDVVLADTALATPGPGVLPPRTPVADLGDRVRALPADATISTAFAAAGAEPATPAYSAPGGRFALTASSRAARGQDLLGAIAAAALTGTPPAGDDALLVSPAVSWAPSADEAAAVMNVLRRLTDSGWIRPVPLAEVRTSPATPAELDPPADVPAPDPRLADLVTVLTDLRAAMVVADSSRVEPDDIMVPLFADVLAALRVDDVQPDSESARATTRAVDDLAAAVGELRDAVTLIPPGGVYTLASESSPVLLVARNALPVPVRVRLDVRGRDADEGEMVTLPARGSRTLSLPASTAGSGKRVDLDIGLALPGGTAVGERAHITVQEGGYGTATVVLTVVAGSALLFMVGRRLWHRFQGEYDPADDS